MKICETEDCEKPAGYSHGKRYQKRYCRSCEHYKKTFGLTVPDVKRMIDEVDGHCPICEVKMVWGVGANRCSTVAVVDHNHETGEVRGVICSQCNRALGMFKDDPARLERALRHLT